MRFDRCAGGVIGFAVILACARSGLALAVFPGSETGSFDPGFAKRLAAASAASGEFARATAPVGALEDVPLSLRYHGFLREAIAGAYSRSIGYAAVQRALEGRPNGEAASSFLSDTDLEGAAPLLLPGSADRG